MISGISEKLDSIFVMDSSSNVNRTIFARMKRFVSDALKAYEISPNRTRVGLITFGKTPVSNLELVAGVNPTVVNQVLHDAQPVGGEQNLPEAIRLAHSKIAPDTTDDSRGRICILLLGSPLPSSALATETKMALERMKNKGITVLVIALGDAVPPDELKSIAKEGEVVKVSDEEDAKNALAKLIDQSEKTSGMSFFFNKFLLPSSCYTNQKYLHQTQSDFSVTLEN